jgi:hypothetical protein
LQDIAKPMMDDWSSALAAVEAALDMEKKVNAVSFSSIQTNLNQWQMGNKALSCKIFEPLGFKSMTQQLRS